MNLPAVLRAAVLLALAATVGLCAPAWLLAAAPGPPATPADAGRRALAEIDSLRLQNRGSLALPLIETWLSRAETASDSGFRLDLLIRRAELNVSLGSARPGEIYAREALAFASQRGDSSAYGQSLRWLAAALLAQGRFPEARRVCRELIPLAERLRDNVLQGWGWIGLAWLEQCEGRPDQAVETCERAAALFQGSRDSNGGPWALNSLGTCLSDLGRYHEAETAFGRSAEQARAAGNRFIESMAVNNLGMLEYSLGDPGAALSSFERARVLHLEVGDRRDTIVPAMNIALCLADLGNLKEASFRLDEAIAECESGGFIDLQGAVLGLKAQIRMREERPREALSLYRCAIALGDSLSEWNRVKVLVGLASALVRLDSIPEARALLEQG